MEGRWEWREGKGGGKVRVEGRWGGGKVRVEGRWGGGKVRVKMTRSEGGGGIELPSSLA